VNEKRDKGDACKRKDIAAEKDLNPIASISVESSQFESSAVRKRLIGEENTHTDENHKDNPGK
jgi:hypothetical protein